MQAIIPRIVRALLEEFFLSVLEFLSCLYILPVQNMEILYWAIKEKSRSIHFLHGVP